MMVMLVCSYVVVIDVAYPMPPSPHRANLRGPGKSLAKKSLRIPVYSILSM